MNSHHDNQHISVLYTEILESLNIRSNGTYVDATMNGGGHASGIASQLDLGGTFIGIDQDPIAIATSSQRLVDTSPTKHLVQDNFRNLSDILGNLDIDSIDGIVFDLGWSTNQFEDPQRGFSFRHDGPLNMRLSGESAEGDLTAREIINEWAPESLIDIISGYGEERFTKRIVEAIVAAREAEPIETTLQLADIIKSAVPVWARFKRIHPATQTFQALRIAVNDELQALREGIDAAVAALAPGGRIAIISFHSLEDRIVKRMFKDFKSEGIIDILTKKPIIPSEQELETNVRSRSAKLRIAEKI